MARRSFSYNVIVTQFRLVLVPPDHEPFGCFEDPPVPLARLLCANGSKRGLSSKHQRGVFGGPLGGSRSEVVN